MKSWMKLLLGLGSHAFTLVFLFFLVSILPRLFVLIQSKADTLPSDFGTFILGMLISVFCFFAVAAFFIVYLSKNQSFSPLSRAMWMLSFFFVGIVALPVFFWSVVWRHPREKGVFAL